MKSIFLTLVVLFIATVGFSQINQKQQPQAQQKKPVILEHLKIVDTLLYQKNAVKPFPVSHKREEHTVMPKNNTDIKTEKSKLARH